MTHDIAQGRVMGQRGRGGQMPSADACVSLRSLALTNNGSQKRVKDSRELTNMVDTNAPWEELDVMLHSKYVLNRTFKLEKGEGH